MAWLVAGVVKASSTVSSLFEIGMCLLHTVNGAWRFEARLTLG
jgi:hypothetical protein